MVTLPTVLLLISLLLATLGVSKVPQRRAIRVKVRAKRRNSR